MFRLFDRSHRDPAAFTTNLAAALFVCLAAAPVEAQKAISLKSLRMLASRQAHARTDSDEVIEASH